MKTLYESLLDNEDEIFDQTSKNIKNEIKRFLNNTYQAKFNISKEPNKDNKYVVNCNYSVIVKNRECLSLTNKYFIFGDIKGNFDCSCCPNLTSLEGMPKEIKGNFKCFSCHSLTSLKGAPKKVGGDFDCSFCSNLISLEGAPIEVGGTFKCSYCSNLKSLKGAPKEVGDIFACEECGKQFDKIDVENVSNVKGKIKIKYENIKRYI